MSTDKGGTKSYDYDVSDKVRIISDTSANGIKIGTIVTLKEPCNFAVAAWYVNEYNTIVREKDFEIVKDVTSTISQWFGYKYKVNPESSRLLQEAVFKDGGKWLSSGKSSFEVSVDYMFVSEDGVMSLTGSFKAFSDNNLPEKQPPQVEVPQPEKVAPQVAPTPPKEFKVNKWYKCVDSSGKENLSEGTYYRLDSLREGHFWTTSKDGERRAARFFLRRFDINSESDFNPDDPHSKFVEDLKAAFPPFEKEYKHTAYVKFKGYSGKYDSKEYCYKLADKDYEMHGNRCTTGYASVDVNGEIKIVQIQRIVKDYVDSKATKCIIGIVEGERGDTVLPKTPTSIPITVSGYARDSGHLEPLVSLEKDFEIACKNLEDRLKDDKIVWPTISQTYQQIKFNQQEEVNMSNVNRVVSVKFFDDDAGLKAENSLVASYEITTRANDAMTVNKLLMREDIAGDIELHNQVRAATVDAIILKNTGNKVFLQPIDFEDLRVVVSNI